MRKKEKKRHLKLVKFEPELPEQELYQVQREGQQLRAEHQLYADLRQLSVELIKLTATATAVVQQVLELTERYRKARE